MVAGREGDRLATTTAVVEEGGIEAGGSRREKRETETKRERETRSRTHEGVKLVDARAYTRGPDAGTDEDREREREREARESDTYGGDRESRRRDRDKVMLGTRWWGGRRAPGTRRAVKRVYEIAPRTHTRNRAPVYRALYPGTHG